MDYVFSIAFQPHHIYRWICSQSQSYVIAYLHSLLELALLGISFPASSRMELWLLLPQEASHGTLATQASRVALLPLLCDSLVVSDRAPGSRPGRPWSSDENIFQNLKWIYESLSSMALTESAKAILQVQFSRFILCGCTFGFPRANVLFDSLWTMDS